MKRTLLLPGLFLMYHSLSAQNPDDILRGCTQKCNSIQQGSYEMRREAQYMTISEVYHSQYNCTFQKREKDTLFASAFHYTSVFNGEPSMEAMYTGIELVVLRDDSIASRMNVDQWSAEIKSYSHNYTLYQPFTERDGFPLFNADKIKTDKGVVTYEGTETINGFSCDRIRITYSPDPVEGDFNTLKQVVELWINKKDSVPVQYTNDYTVLMAGDTMYQHEKDWLTIYSINQPLRTGELTMYIVPSYYKVEDYAPSETPDLLKENTKAPEWELTSLDNKTVSLKSLKGKIVLVDFFYKSCYPCMMAIPVLQKLYDKYKDKGLVVVGIDPYDTNRVDLKEFLGNKGVTYPILLGGKNAAADYKISGYPTLYILDKKGMILHTSRGYSEDMETELENVIQRHIK